MMWSFRVLKSKPIYFYYSISGWIEDLSEAAAGQAEALQER